LSEEENLIEVEPDKVSKEKSIDPYSLEDVPGLGPVSMKALAKEGFHTSFQVICKNPTWLKEVTGMDRNKAADAFQYMKSKLIDAGILNKQEFSATELLELREKIPRLATGCKSIDNLLDGGIEFGSIYEFVGENGSGKTQNSHNFAVQALRPVKEGGSAEEGKELPTVIYVDTENTFRPERIVTMLAGKGMIMDLPEKLKKKILENKVLTIDERKEYDSEKLKQKKEATKFLDQIIVQKASDAMQQMSIIQNIISLVETMNIKLVIVDSGTALFRSGYLGRGNMKTKFDLMNEMIADLKALAENGHIPVVFVNQIYHKPDEMYGADPDIPYGGNIIGHAIPYIIKLMKSGRQHKMWIKKSPKDDNNDCKFQIDASGIIDEK